MRQAVRLHPWCFTSETDDRPITATTALVIFVAVGSLACSEVSLDPRVLLPFARLNTRSVLTAGGVSALAWVAVIAASGRGSTWFEISPWRCRGVLVGGASDHAVQDRDRQGRASVRACPPTGWEAHITTPAGTREAAHSRQSGHRARVPDRSAWTARLAWPMCRTVAHLPGNR